MYVCIISMVPADELDVSGMNGKDQSHIHFERRCYPIAWGSRLGSHVSGRKNDGSISRMIFESKKSTWMQSMWCNTYTGSLFFLNRVC